jgi:hypothetical protein
MFETGQWLCSAEHRQPARWSNPRAFGMPPHIMSGFPPRICGRATRLCRRFELRVPSLEFNPKLETRNPKPTLVKRKRLKKLRTEAVRIGFKHCYQQKDYTTILVVTELLPDSVLNKDEQLQMIYDTAVTRNGVAAT